MAFTLDTKHSAVVEKNLFLNSVLQSGVTYTTRWQGDASAGVVKIMKLTKGTVLTDGKGISSGFDLTVGADNTLLSLNLDKPYSLSTAIYDVQEASVSVALAEEHMEMNTMSITETTHNATEFFENSVFRSLPKSFLPVVRLTSRPAAVDIIRAGIWPTRPSPNRPSAAIAT